MTPSCWCRCDVLPGWPFTRDLKIRRNFPQATIVAGGEHITALSEYSMQDCAAIDYCVLGEGEDTTVELVDALCGKGQLANVEGISYRQAGKITYNKRRSRIRAIQDVPRPAWDLVPIESYLSAGAMTGVNFGRSMPILASRGCPYQCTFCSSPAMWGR